MILVEEDHLHPIGIVWEAVHGRQYDCYGNIVGIDEVQDLDYGYENFLIDALLYAILSHKIV